MTIVQRLSWDEIRLLCFEHLNIQQGSNAHYIRDVRQRVTNKTLALLLLSHGVQLLQ